MSSSALHLLQQPTWLSSSRHRRAAALCCFVALVAMLHFYLSRTPDSRTGAQALMPFDHFYDLLSNAPPPSPVASAMLASTSSHGVWQVGELHGQASITAPLKYSSVPDHGVDLVASGNLGHVMRIVPRKPHFDLLRPRSLPPAPNGSLHLERLPPEAVGKTPTSCLAARASPRLLRSPPTWTLEAVVLFLDNPHFGQVWQSIIGRNGALWSSLGAASQ